MNVDPNLIAEANKEKNNEVEELLDVPNQNVSTGTPIVPNNSSNIEIDSLDAIPLDNNTLANGLPDPKMIQKKEEVEVPKKKKKKVLPIILIILLLILAFGGFVAYKILSVDAKTVYSTIIDEVFKKAAVVVNNTDPYKSRTTFMTTGNATISSNIKGYETLQEYSLEYRYGMDDTNNIEAYLNVLESKKSIIDVLLYKKNNNVYIQSEKVFNKMVNFGEVSSTDSLNNQMAANLNASLNNIKTTFKTQLSDRTLKRELTDLTVNGKNTKVFANTLTLFPEQVNNIYKSIIANLPTDEQTKNMLVESLNQTTTTNDKLGNAATADAKYKIVVYTSILKNEVLALKAYDLSGNEFLTYKKNNSSIDVILTYGKYYISLYGPKTKLNLTVNYDGYSFINGIIEKNETGNTITLNLYSSYITTGIADENEEPLNLVFNTMSNSNNNGELVEMYTITLNVNNQNKTNSIVINIQNKTTYDVKVAQSSVGKAIDYNTISEDDLIKSRNKLENIIYNSKAFNEIGVIYFGDILKNNLQNEIDSLVGAAKTAYKDELNKQNSKVTNMANVCINADYLINNDYLAKTGSFDGSVLIKKDGTIEFWIKNSNYHFTGANYETYSIDNAKNTETGSDFTQCGKKSTVTVTCFNTNSCKAK